MQKPTVLQYRWPEIFPGRKRGLPGKNKQTKKTLNRVQDEPEIDIKFYPVQALVECRDQHIQVQLLRSYLHKQTDLCEMVGTTSYEPGRKFAVLFTNHNIIVVIAKM